MSEWLGVFVRVQIDATSAEIPALAGHGPFACGRLLGSGSPVLVRGAHRPGAEIVTGSEACVTIPDATAERDRLRLPAVATVLAAWRTLGLELGDAAVWTGTSELSKLAGDVALWSGACPGVQLADGTPAAPTSSRVVDWNNPEKAMSTLVALGERRPGFAALELTGRAEVIDILLEAMPRWGRLLLAGPAGQPVTLDFYKNIHRKGIVLTSTTLDVSLLFDAQRGAPIRNEMERAAAVLTNAAMGERCRNRLASRQTAPAVAVTA